MIYSTILKYVAILPSKILLVILSKPSIVKSSTLLHSSLHASNLNNYLSRLQKASAEWIFTVLLYLLYCPVSRVFSAFTFKFSALSKTPENFPTIPLAFIKLYHHIPKFISSSQISIKRANKFAIFFQGIRLKCRDRISPKNRCSSLVCLSKTECNISISSPISNLLQALSVIIGS